MTKKSKKRKKNEVLTLRREIEALKAQLKHQDISRTSAIEKKKRIDKNIDYEKIEEKRIEQESLIENSKTPQSYLYLKKETLKTAVFSLAIIGGIIIIKALKLF